MTDPNPLVGIVFVNFNGLKFMPDCLESLQRQDYPNLCPVIVDNASSDGSREWLATLSDPFNVVFLDENTGITGGNNVGIRKCLELGCDEICLLNNDTILEPDAIRRLVAAREPQRLLVPRIYFHDSPTLINTSFGDFDYVRGISLPRFYGCPDSELSGTTAEGTMASSCAIMFPANLIEEVGMMDDRFFIYYDDTDFVTRSVLAGYRVKYVPEAKLFHRESSSSGGQRTGPLPLYYLTRNRLYFMEKHQKNPVKKLAFYSYFWSAHLIHMARWFSRTDRASFFAFRSGVQDYRARRFGYANPSRYRLDQPRT